MADTRAELIARLEKTAGPNLELESAIYFETAASDHIKAFHARQPGGQSFTQTLAALGIVPPRYTSSLDAAMTLSEWAIPGKYRPFVQVEFYANGRANCGISPWWKKTRDDEIWSREQATAPLAICIAMFKAAEVERALRAAAKAAG